MFLGSYLGCLRCILVRAFERVGALYMNLDSLMYNLGSKIIVLQFEVRFLLIWMVFCHMF